MTIVIYRRALSQSISVVTTRWMRLTFGRLVVRFVLIAWTDSVRWNSLAASQNRKRIEPVEWNEFESKWVPDLFAVETLMRLSAWQSHHRMMSHNRLDLAEPADRDKRFTFTFSSDSCLLIMFIGFLVGNRHPPSANFYPGQSLHWLRTIPITLAGSLSSPTLSQLTSNAFDQTVETFSFTKDSLAKIVDQRFFGHLNNFSITYWQPKIPTRLQAV